MSEVGDDIEQLDVSSVRRLTRPTVILRALDQPWLVLGSQQADLALRATPALRLARRRGGGGAVMLSPADAIWIDLWLPATGPSYSADAGRQLELAGQLLLRELEHRGLSGLSLARPQGPVGVEAVCFLGRGPGEVLDEHGAKLVGLSAWRAREGALVQCALYRRRDLLLAELLELEPPARAELRRALFREVSDLEGLGSADLDAPDLCEALAARLGGAFEQRPPELTEP